MCGICGIINFKNEPVTDIPLRQMMQRMKHRGPDDEGVFIKKNIGLGFVRLSIIDLSSAGHQPMISNDGRYVIVLNGEIFNYIEIREELKDFYPFKSNTDTEVLLAAFMKWGKNCLDILNGMFAFVILDTLTMNVFGARDRFGIKPFYYTIDNNRFIFASDIPLILSLLNSKPDQNDSIIYDFLVYNRTNHLSQTFFRNIYKLQHGHLLQLIGNILNIKRWYSLDEKVKELQYSDYTSNRFFQDFSTSIDLQLRSDVPLGTCLSGGLDSSSITSVVKNKSRKNQLHTFSAIYGKGTPGDESDFIDEYNKTGLNMHFTHPTADSLFEDINRFHDALSEPIPNTSEYAEFKVMELAKDYCTVILNGQGADEIMAGYHYFFGYFFKDLFKQKHFPKLASELYHYLRLHKSLTGIKSFIFALHPHWFKELNTSSLNKEFIDSFSDNLNPIMDDFYNSNSLEEFLIKHFEYKFEHHLLWADKSGMYFSIETRFPFLDHTLVEKTLASGISINKGCTKYLLRDAMKDVLPEKIRTRVDKIGYQTPEHIWFNEPHLKGYFLDIMHSASFKSRSYLDNSRCLKSINDYQKSGKYNKEFWKWLSLELWMRKYIDK